MTIKRHALVLLSLVVLLLSICLACVPKEVPTDEAEQIPKGKIVIGILDDLSGPTAGTCTAYKDGLEACIRYINEEQGGISGHQVEAIVIDTKMDAKLAVGGWARLSDEGVPVVMSLITAAAAPVLDASAQRDHIPVLAGAGSMNQLFPKEPSFWFCTAPEVVSTYDSVVRMIESDWAERGIGGNPKVGFDFVSLGTAAKIWGKRAKMLMVDKGWEYTITRTSVGPADVTTQVLQMKELGVEYIFIACTEAANVVWLKELDRQNFRPTIFGSTNMASQEIWHACGKLAVGAICYVGGAQWTDTDLPMVRLCHDLNAKWSPEVDWRPAHYVRSFADMLAVTEALRRAVENVGYESLNGIAMREAMETVRDYDPIGYGIGYTWTPNDHQGIHGGRWYTWTEDGVMVPYMREWDVFEPLPEEQRSDAYWLK